MRRFQPIESLPLLGTITAPVETPEGRPMASEFDIFQGLRLMAFTNVRAQQVGFLQGILEPESGDRKPVKPSIEPPDL